MITTQSVDAMAETARNMVNNIAKRLPAIFEDMRATAADRERLIAELDAAHQNNNALNIAVADLRADKRALDDRVAVLLAENAKLTCLLQNIGAAVKQSTEVQDSLDGLAGHRNGRTKLIEGSTTPPAGADGAAHAANGNGSGAVP